MSTYFFFLQLLRSNWHVGEKFHPILIHLFAKFLSLWVNKEKHLFYCGKGAQISKFYIIGSYIEFFFDRIVLKPCSSMFPLSLIVSNKLNRKEPKKVPNCKIWIFSFCFSQFVIFQTDSHYYWWWLLLKNNNIQPNFVVVVSSFIWVSLLFLCSSCTIWQW